MFSKLNYQQKEEEKPYIGETMKPPQLARLQGMPVRGLTDLPMDSGASTSNHGAAFARQDSLAIAASLQQRDRERYPVDFMETELDLDNYLQCFTDLDVPADNVDFDDAELQKVNILYDGEPRYEQPVRNGYERHVAYTPGFRKPGEYDQDAYQMNCEIKTEELEPMVKARREIKRPAAFNEYQDEYSGDSTDMSDDNSVDDSYFEPKPKNARNNRNGLGDFKPQTRARKYNLKPDVEKAEPTYKLKRARNNDAVRKSRNKAKELQKKKEEELDKMKRKIAELEGQLASEREARRRDQDLLKSLLQNKSQRNNNRNVLENFNK